MENENHENPPTYYYQCQYCLVLYASLSLLKEHKCLNSDDKIADVAEKEKSTNSPSDKNRKSNKTLQWSHGMVLCLLGLYKQHRSKFDDVEYTKKRVSIFFFNCLG